MSIDLGIQVVQGGERLYIHPIAYYEYGKGKNKVLYYRPQEFALYKTEFVIRSSQPSDYINVAWRPQSWFKLGWMLSVGRVSNSLREAFMHCWTFKEVKGFWRIFRYHFNNGTPFYGVSIFPGYVSVNGQLAVKDPERYTETFYLIPSQKYLKLRFEEWALQAASGLPYLNSEEPEEDDDCEWINTIGSLKFKAEVLLEYREWEKEWLDKGCSIGFVCSLDT